MAEWTHANHVVEPVLTEDPVVVEWYLSALGTAKKIPKKGR